MSVEGRCDRSTYPQTNKVLSCHRYSARENIYPHTCPPCSHSTGAGTICSCLPLYQQWNSISSSCLVPTYPVQSSCVLKGWLYSLLFYDFIEPLLPAFEAGKSWPKLSDPCCKPQSGQDLSQSPPPGLFPLALSHTPGPHSSCSMQLEQIYVSSTDFFFFSGHFWGAHKVALPVHVDLRGICPGGGLYENKQADKRRLVFCEAVRFSGEGGGDGRGKQPLPKSRTSSAEWALSRGRARRVNKQSGDTICRGVDIAERGL